MMTASPDTNAALVQEGDNVILDVNGEKQAFVVAKRAGKVKVNRQLCQLDPIIGQPYGSVYSLSADTSELVRIKRPRTNEWSSVEEVDKDNSELLDIGAASQQLSVDDIAALRAAGRTGEEIVAALAEGSATFQGKTQFSQAKYKKKKHKKYTLNATIQWPTASSLCEAYFNKSSAKINHLRVDSLAMLLSLANIGSHAKVLVLETCSGLVTAAVAERLGGFGHVCTTYLGDRCVPLEATRMLNFSDSVKQSMSTAALSTLLQYQAAESPSVTAQTSTEGLDQVQPAAAAAVLPQGQAPMPAEGQTAGQLQAAANGQQSSVNGQQAAVDGQQASADGQQPAADGQESGQQKAELPIVSPVQNEQVAEVNGVYMRDVLEDNSEQPQPDVLSGLAGNQQTQPGPQEVPSGRQEHSKRMKERHEATQSLLKIICKSGFDCCIVAAPEIQPTSLMQKLMPLLAPSASFAMFSNWQQPLAECHLALQQSKQALNLALAESWWREHQVLPARTHPTMSMSGTGGYILSGTKITN